MALTDLDDLFQDIILDHYKNPRNKGELEKPDLRAEGDNPFCGDAIQIDILLNDDRQVVKVAFSGNGCSISQASASILSEMIKGKSIEEIENLVRLFRQMIHGENLSETEIDVLGELQSLHGVTKFPIRIKCALLAPLILEDGIKQFSR